MTNHGEDHPLWALQRIAERKLAPLGPIFTAMDARWTALVRPERALKSILLMAFFDVGDRKGLCTHVAENPAFRTFLDHSTGVPPLDAADLSQALDRLRPNAHARKFIRDVLEAADEAGLSNDARFSVNGSVVDEWTSSMPTM